jgi:hypothetical protein
MSRETHVCEFNIISEEGGHSERALSASPFHDDLTIIKSSKLILRTYVYIREKPLCIEPQKKKYPASQAEKDCVKTAAC